MEDYRQKDETGVNIIYIVGVILISKLIYSIFKSDNVNNEQSQKTDKIDRKSSTEKPKELGKNKWLHSADDFGKMESGRVL